VTRRSVALTFVALALAFLLAVPAQGAFVVKASSETFSFKPKRAEVARGTRVVWRAVGGTHTVTAYGGGWSKDRRIAAGEETGFTFKTRGTFKYRCRIHSTLSYSKCTGMCGRVVVV